MIDKKEVKMKQCKNCNKMLDRIWFTAMMTEEWAWNGQGYNENTARHSLVTDVEQPVLCPYCGEVVGTGLDFGFGVDYR